MKNGTLLITGGNGMVGRNLQSHLAAVDWRVLAPTSKELNLLDANSVEEYVRLNRPDAVIHAAGVVGGIHANMAAPVKFLAENAQIGINVVTVCAKLGVEKLVNLASSCMYPKDIGSDLREDKILSGPLEPTNEGYALAKILAMRLCDYVGRENPSLMYKTLVPCNLYGLWDSFLPERSHLVPAIIDKVHRAKVESLSTVEIWGDGTARREFMFAGDLADAVMRAVNNPGSLPGSMNIGLGHDHSINDYYNIVSKVIGWDGAFHHDLTRPTGMKQKLLNVDRQREWGWVAPTSLEDGIRKTYDFYLREYHQ